MSYLGGTTGAGKHIWTVKLEELMDLYRVRKCPSKELFTILIQLHLAFVLLHIHLCLVLYLHQTLHSLLLCANLFPLGIVVASGSHCRIGSHTLISYHYLGNHGQCLQTSLPLLDTIQRHRREMHQYQPILSRIRNSQHAQRSYHSDHPFSANSSAPNDLSEEISNLWHYGRGNLVCLFLFLPKPHSHEQN